MYTIRERECAQSIESTGANDRACSQTGLKSETAQALMEQGRGSMSSSKI